jgi:hypothetical protein
VDLVRSKGQGLLISYQSAYAPLFGPFIPIITINHKYYCNS